MKTSTNFSFGIKYSFLFGNQFIDDELYTYDVVIDTILRFKEQKIKDYIIKSSTSYN